MKKALLTVLLVASVAMVGCGDDEEGLGGNGGTGGPPGTGGSGGSEMITWTSSNLDIVFDDPTAGGCEFFAGGIFDEFDMIIDGNEVTLSAEGGMMDFEVSTDDYAPEDTVIVLEGMAVDTRFLADGCEVQFDEQMTLRLDDPTVSLAENDTVTVEPWFHFEESLSSDGCDGVWFVDLPCESEATFTLRQ